MAHDDPSAPSAMAPTVISDGATLPSPDSASDTRVAPGPGEAEGLRRGAQLGRFVLLERLGEGGMGVVYSAYDEKLDRRVAVKLLRPDVWGRATDSEGKARLLREAQAMARLSHPNVVTVYEVGTHGEGLFVAMEYVEGQTLGQWLREKRRPLAEVLPLLLAAGRGLAAAHHKGLVHRDFKPDNVLVGRDGQVRVSDFGLVRQAGEGAGAGTPPSPSSSAFPDTRSSQASNPGASDAATLTRTGGLMGTPGYMAPEQAQDAKVDARADQYAFCATLHVALLGRLPRKEDAAAAAATQAGRPSRLSRRKRVPDGRPDPSSLPPRLRAALARGLSERPEARFPSMEALLAELQASVAPRHLQPRAWAAAAALLLVAGGGVVWRARAGAAQVCRGAEARLAGVWDAGVAGAVQRSLVAADPRLGPELAQRVRERLDGYASDWKAMHTEACEATAVHQVQSPALLDLRMACLERRRSGLRATAQLLSSTTEQSVARRAPQLAHGLDDLSECADAARLTAAFPPPKDAAVAQKVDATRERLEDGKVLHRAGSYPKAEERLGQVIAEARTLGHPPLLAEALVALGRLHNSQQKGKEAEGPFTEGAELAARTRDAALEAEAWAGLVGAYSYQARHKEAELAGRVAGGALARAGEPLALRVMLLTQLADLASGQGRYAQGAALSGEAARLLESQPGGAGGASAYVHAMVLSNLGADLSQLDRRAEAREVLQRADALYVRSVGASHPHRALLLIHLGHVAEGEERASQALAHYEEALRIAERIHAPDDRAVSMPLGALANTLLQLGRFEEAHALIQRVIAIRLKHDGAGHPNLGFTYGQLGEWHLFQGRAAEALAEFERTRALFAKAGHPAAVYAEESMAQALLALGRAAEARALLERVVAGFAAGDAGAEGEDTLRARVELAEALLALGREGPAREHLRWADGVLGRSQAGPGLRGRAHLALARALWPAREERLRALALARTALEELGRSETAVARRLLGEGRAWLAAAERAPVAGAALP
jgi:tetratricopeptide (TPR) repeat protein